MNVLSLFDGISCGQVALNRIGIKYNNYYACEIDKFAKMVTQENFPNTFQLGDINNWKNWGFDFGSIDLIFAGFPCQAWSVAGKQKGENDPRGALVHTLIDIWKEVRKKNPNVKFLFENVRMKKEFLDYINDLFGVEPIKINSALVSAQNRERFYWTNIENVNQPEDKGTQLKEVLEHGKTDRLKSYYLDANYFKGTNLAQYLKKCRRQVVFNYSSSGRGNGVIQDRFYDSEDSKAYTLTKTGYSRRSFTGVYNEDGIRKLTPLECERLQTLPDNYTHGVSNSQRYKSIGNGWTVDVISHILKGLKND